MSEENKEESGAWHDDVPQFEEDEDETKTDIESSLEDSSDDISSEEISDFRATIWTAIKWGEQDFLTRREMAEILEEIAEDINYKG